MGWLFIERPDDVKKYLIDSYTRDDDRRSQKVLEIAMTLKAAYTALEIVNKEKGTTEVICAVTLLKYIPGSLERFNFGMKDMDETWGPNEQDCPARVLGLLTPTDNETALEWRAACRKRAKRRVPPFNAKVRFKDPIRFTDGQEETDFTVIRYGKRAKRLKRRGGGFVKVANYIWKDREWDIVESFA